MSKVDNYNQSVQSPTPSDFAFLCASVAFLVWATYQPFFFGDEVAALHVSAYSDNNFWSTYRSLNAYKPRLLYNAAWAAFGSYGATRALVAGLYAAGLAACAAALFSLVRPFCSRALAWLVVAIALTSRFAATIYSDYLSGTIEAWSLALLMAAIVVLSRSAWLKGNAVDLGRLALATALLIGATLVHERYAAPAMAIGVLVSGIGVHRMIRGENGASLLRAGAVLAILPVGLFAAITPLFSNVPLTTGTSGQQVSVNLGTLHVVGTYLLNVLLGMNFGKPWFVGTLNEAHSHARYVFGIAGVALLIAWLMPLIRRRDMIVWSSTALLLAMAALALVAVASLPGIERQEMRWMFPVQLLVLGAVALTYRGVSRIALLMLLLCVNGYYLLFGGLSSVFAVAAPRTAEKIALHLNSVRAGSRGIVLQAPEPDTTWIITGGPYIDNNARSAAVFCSVNVESSACVAPSAEIDRQQTPYDFGYVVAPDPVSGTPSIDVLTGDALAALLDPSLFDRVPGEVIGGNEGWDGWRWNRPPAGDSGKLALVPGDEGNVPVPINSSGRMFVAYKAAAAGESSMLRMQVIWTDAAGAQIGAEGEISTVLKAISNHVMVVHAPSGAKTGYIYAIVPAHATGPLSLAEVKIIRWAPTSKK